MAETKRSSTTAHENGQAEENGQSMAATAQQRIGEVAGGMVGVMENARDVAQNVASQFPTAADTTRQIMDQASRQMQSSSDEMLMVGSALAFGVTLGLFLSGSNRLLVATALVPAVAMGATLLDRRSRAGA